MGELSESRDLQREQVSVTRLTRSKGDNLSALGVLLDSEERTGAMRLHIMFPTEMAKRTGDQSRVRVQSMKRTLTCDANEIGNPVSVKQRHESIPQTHVTPATDPESNR